MLHHLKKWLTTSAGSRHDRRRDRLHVFHGHVESLETRNVLSAYAGTVSIESGPGDFHETGIALGYADVSRMSDRQLDVDHFANNSVAISAPRAPWRPAGLDHRLDDSSVALTQRGPAIEQAWGGRPPVPPYNAPIGLMLVTVTFSYPNHEVATGDSSVGANRPPQMIKQPSEPTNEVGIAFPVVSAPSQPSHQVNYTPPTAPGFTPAPTSFYPAIGIDADRPLSYTARTVGTYDAAFDQYGARQLLLVAKATRDTELDAVRGADESSELDDDSSVELTVHEESILFDDVAMSLQSVRRERDAIDAVLARLHDVELDVEDHAQSEYADHPPVPGKLNDAERDAPSAGELSQPPAIGAIESGGMVLLQPSGDANQMAYDAHMMLLSSSGESMAMPGHVEAAIGIYQAFDAGIVVPEPARESATPLRAPAASMSPSASAEDHVKSNSTQSS